MIVEEMLPENSFESWPSALREELEERSAKTEVGQILCYEDETIRVWRIALEPGERLPFHRHTRDYSWTCLTDGVGTTYYGTGDAYRITYRRGDQAYFSHRDKGDFLHDLQNVGESVLEFVTVEYAPEAGLSAGESLLGSPRS